MALAHAVLENDAPDDDGDGGGKGADEAEGSSCGSDVAGEDFGLEGDKGGLEVWACSQTGKDLVDDNFVPGVAARREVDEKAKSEGGD